MTETHKSASSQTRLWGFLCIGLSMMNGVALLFLGSNNPAQTLPTLMFLFLGIIALTTARGLQQLEQRIKTMEDSVTLPSSAQ
jgi:hypothetical protein